jgi:hypothetical protein
MFGSISNGLVIREEKYNSVGIDAADAWTLES